MKEALVLNGYPFAWLDEVTEITLNPECTGFQWPDAAGLADLQKRYTTELAQAFTSLKRITFLLFFPKKISAVACQYQEALEHLLRQARQNLAQYPAGEPLTETGEQLIMLLEASQRRLQQRYAHYLPKAIQEEPPESESVPPLYKVLCKLSVDQIAIILKAADDAKVLVSRSLSLVFRSIMPYLSTDKMKNISWKSARSSTYKFEDADKDAAIQTLEKLIAKIKGY